MNLSDSGFFRQRRLLVLADAEDPSACAAFLRGIEAPASPMKFGALVPRGSNWGPAILTIKDGRVVLPGPHFLDNFLRKVILRWCADTQNDRF